MGSATTDGCCGTAEDADADAAGVAASSARIKRLGPAAGNGDADVGAVGRGLWVRALRKPEFKCPFDDSTEPSRGLELDATGASADVMASDILLMRDGFFDVATGAKVALPLSCETTEARSWIPFTEAPCMRRRRAGTVGALIWEKVKESKGEDAGTGAEGGQLVVVVVVDDSVCISSDSGSRASR